ncbi:uncharacterized protein B0I36DRAFT_324766 [Microdochium trichocladiopsis]|uniref:Secreted protein n=1 Tax=Microdochium trichocladiopsis TaxID=1682393 RepID=A0A9P9BLU0_9PEZI|nr:uncharacterized protein B0I36DRAFT_324766 [Microdochium trichocladiopsis]KAH7028943.1 hypothetical protein B0I36DRAFT_324766 [Microdochium trichocladiopsis]
MRHWRHEHLHGEPWLELLQLLLLSAQIFARCGLSAPRSVPVSSDIHCAHIAWKSKFYMGVRNKEHIPFRCIPGGR